jgi:hypothetical protein
MQKRIDENLIIMHGTRPTDAYICENAIRVNDPLEGGGEGGLLVALRPTNVVVPADPGLWCDDRDVGGVHGTDDVWDIRDSLKATLEGGDLVRPPKKVRHKPLADGGADLEDDLLAGRKAEAEAVRDCAEGLSGGKAPDADGYALAHRDGRAEWGVLLGDGRAQRITYHVKGVPTHPEVAAKFVLGVVRAAAVLPPRA